MSERLLDKLFGETRRGWNRNPAMLKATDNQRKCKKTNEIRRKERKAVDPRDKRQGKKLEHPYHNMGCITERPRTLLKSGKSTRQSGRHSTVANTCTECAATI